MSTTKAMTGYQIPLDYWTTLYFPTLKDAQKAYELLQDCMILRRDTVYKIERDEAGCPKLYHRHDGATVGRTGIEYYRPFDRNMEEGFTLKKFNSLYSREELSGDEITVFDAQHIAESTESNLAPEIKRLLPSKVSE